MKTLVSVRNNWWPLSNLTNAIKAIDKLVSTNIKVYDEPFNKDLKKIWIEHDEVEGGNCVVLFGMWYDLNTETFSISRSDMVTGVKLFTADDLYKALGMRTPRDLDDRVLEYKATGKLSALFSEEEEVPATFLQYFLQDVTPKKDVDKVKFFKELVENVRDLSEGLREISIRVPQAKNIFYTAPTTYLRDVFNEADLYAASCKLDVTGGDTMSKLKAVQTVEILEAESVRASDGYLDPVTLTIEKTPTFKRITARERSSVKVSVERFPNENISYEIRDNVRGLHDISNFKRFFVEIGKCVSKSLEV